MNDAILGALQEARYIGEVLLTNPTPENFALYRRAVTHLAQLQNIEIEEATQQLLKLIDNNF